MNRNFTWQDNWIERCSPGEVRERWQKQRMLFKRAARTWELLPLLGTRTVAPILLFAMPAPEFIAGILACSAIWYLFAVRVVLFETAICISVLSNPLISIPVNLGCALLLTWNDADGAFLAAIWTSITYLIEPVWPRGNTSLIERALRKRWRQYCENM